MATVVMGYRMSTHESLTHMTWPTSRHGYWAVAERAEMFKNDIPMAMRNPATAHAWDQLRYAYTNGGTFRPKPKQYPLGDFGT